MTIQEACTILGVDTQDDQKTIKSQFRKLMTIYHPDSVGSDAPEHRRNAQRINEAYALLRKRPVTDKERAVKRTTWRGKVIKEAFTERSIYIQGIFGDEHRLEYYEAAKGRYEWDPDLEEFECLLRSLNQVVMELLEKIEHQNELYNDYQYDIKAQRFLYQVQLFHLLAGQFVPSVSCLKKIAEPEETDERGRVIYKFQAFLGAKGNGEEFLAMSKMKEGDLVFATSIKNNRINVSNAAGIRLGHLSFADDQLYYVIIPILQHHLAQVKFIVRETEAQRRTRPFRVKVNIDLYLRMNPITEEATTADSNMKIQALLNRYDAFLKKLSYHREH